MKYLLTAIFMSTVLTAESFAVIKRHDVEDKQYRLETAPDFLINMPHEGHGVLIAPHWINTTIRTQ